MTEQPRSRFRDMLRGRSGPSERIITSDVDEAIPFGLRIGAGFAWRLLIIAAGLAGLVWLVIQFKLLIIPLMVAILVTALLWPAFELMLRKRFPRWLAIVVSLTATVAIVGGLLWLVTSQVARELPAVREKTQESIQSLRDYVVSGPLGLSEDQLQQYLAEILSFVNEQSQTLLSGALAIGATAGHVVTGALLAVFALICLLADGGGIWRWTVKLFPKSARAAVDGAGRNGWQTIVNYARTQLLVATIDAIGIGLGAALLGVPMAIPVAVLVFLGSFVPIVGAVVTGAVAVFLALVYNGPVIALAMLAVVLVVQQLEGQVLQPILMGSAVKVHPLAVVMVVAGGAMIGGIPGALFAVPLAAFANVVAVSLSRGSWRTGLPEGADLIWNTVPRPRRK